MFKFIAAVLFALASGLACAATEINQAGQAELESVKGIGPSMATRILDARKVGPFADWADLRTRVKGVGEGNAKKFSAQGLTVNGKSYTVVATAPAAALPKAKAPGKAEKAEKVEKAKP
ncbi:MAG: helix-hairpin-helix domain-containing protein [Piscinibacter sp.]|nr:helix-hairpin-helix domain-containing protein [Piscinibacter sp.]